MFLVYFISVSTVEHGRPTNNVIFLAKVISVRHRSAEYGVWVPGVPVLIGDLLDKINCAEWLSGLLLDGIVSGVGAVLSFVPQMLVLFLLLAFLEACGYMARIAFVMDRIFRKFGLSGKSFIPIHRYRLYVPVMGILHHRK